MKLRTCSDALAHAFGLSLPPSLADDRGDAHFEKTPGISFAEKAMAEASGITPEARRVAITALYRSPDSAESFRTGLERAGDIPPRASAAPMSLWIAQAMSMPLPGRSTA